MAGAGLEPLRVPAGFWARPAVVDALRTRDFGALFRLVAKYAGASQTKIAIAVGMTQGHVSTIIAGDRRVTVIEVAERALNGLGAPAEAWTAFGFAPPAARTGAAGQGAARVPKPRADAAPERASEEDVDRRNVLRLGRAALLGGAAGSVGPLRERLSAVARSLTPWVRPGGDAAVVGEVPSSRALAAGVARVKRDYQACRYSAALERLPGLLDAVRLAAAVGSGDELLSVHRYAADAYQVAGSVMLKLGDLGLAAFSADRSMEAAIRCQDPIVLAASARIVTHSLMQGGHTVHASEIAAAAAERLALDTSGEDPEATSVYGALLLRGAVAAAMNVNRTNALELLDEAAQAATRLGRDDNEHWTAFGPTNVAQHRVHVAMLLGDAGTAVDLAARIDVSRIELAERKAALFIDTASALTQWGKHERAYGVLRAAEDVAPEEVRAKSSVHRLIVELADRSPLSMRHRVRDFADRIGVQL